MLQAAKYIGSGLATIGLTKTLLAPLLSPRLLCPSVISPLADKAIVVVDQMLRSLPKDNPVLQHITTVSKDLDVNVSAKVQDGLIVPDNQIGFPDGNIPRGTPSDAGVYVFLSIPLQGERSEQAIGSAIDFSDRLGEHKVSFEGRSRQTNLHRTVPGLHLLTWGPVYILPNYLTSFYAAYPGYTLSQGEYDILMAVTQLLPRILEQSLLSSFTCNLNGQDQLVRFRYISFYLSSLAAPLVLGSTSIPVDIIQNGQVIMTASSIEQAGLLIGYNSRTTTMRYLNHITPAPSSVLGPVNLQVVGYDQPLRTEPIIHRGDNESQLPTLIIPNIESSSSLPIGSVYAFNPDKTLYGEFPSITAAAAALNPSLSRSRGAGIKIGRHINAESCIPMELGNFYFMENPNNDRFTKNHAGIYPCELHDLVLGTCTPFEGLRPIVTHLKWFSYPGKNGDKKVTYDRLKTCYDRSTSFSDARLLFGRFKIVPTKKS